MNGSVLFDYMFPSLYHHEILGVITNDRSDLHAKSQGQRSKVKVTEVTTQLNHIRTKKIQFELTYDDKIMHIAWCCLGEVSYCFSKSSIKFQGCTALKLVEFDPDWAFPDCNTSLNSPMATNDAQSLK